MNQLQKINILGFEISKITTKEVLCEIEKFIQDRKPHTIVLLNPYLILEARKYPEYTEYIKNVDLVTADGFGLLFAARLLGDYFPERVTGTDLMPLLGKLCQEKKYKLFFIGGELGIDERAKKEYERQFPGINIVGTKNGYFSIKEEPEIVAEIKSKKPDILVVCMGAYKQEMFIKRHLKELNIPVCFGNGAAFDFIAGKVKRAPRWMQNAGLEWVFRLIQEPKRLWKRYLIGNTVFMVLLFKELIKKHFGDKGHKI